MDFLKDLFGGGSLSYEQFGAAVKQKGMTLVDAANGAYVPKSDADNLRQQIGTLTSQLGDANKKLEGYDPNWKTQAEAERQKLEAMQFEFALEKGVAGAHPRNTKAVMALIDREKLKYAGGEIIGLDKQLEELQKGEDTAFLFGEPQTVSRTGLSHQNNTEGVTDKKDAANSALRAFTKGAIS
jgi:hypothetical protein